MSYCTYTKGQNKFIGMKNQRNQMFILTQPIYKIKKKNKKAWRDKDKKKIKKEMKHFYVRQYHFWYKNMYIYTNHLWLLIKLVVLWCFVYFGIRLKLHLWIRLGVRYAVMMKDDSHVIKGHKHLNSLHFHLILWNFVVCLKLFCTSFISVT